MSGSRRTSVALLCAWLVGCGAEPEAANESAPVARSDMPEVAIVNAVAPAETKKETANWQDLKKGPSSVPGETRPTPSPPDYRAIGTEPFWAVTVRGSSATLERPGVDARSYAVVRDADDRAIRYRGEGFAMTVSEGPCSDGMSDAVWSDRVTVAFGEGALKGCGGERDAWAP